MQFNRIDQIDQAKVEYVEKLNKTKDVDDKDKVIADEQYKNAQNKTGTIPSNEVVLDNVKFGYDKETKNFFIRIDKEGGTYQFPTEQILRLKAELQESVNEQLNNVGKKRED